MLRSHFRQVKAIFDCVAKPSRAGYLKAASTAKPESVYSSELKFTSLEDWPTIPVFRTIKEDGSSLEGARESGFPEDLARDIYRTMLRLNTAENVFHECQRQGRLQFYMTSFGEEAVSVATAAALDARDEIFFHYREQGFLLWRGVTIKQLADQYTGNALEASQGRHMPLCFSFPAYHVHTVSPVLATQVPHAVGAAFALKAERKPQVAVTFVGDGASSEGDFHAGLNFAATFGVPIIFVCRNNGYAISTPTHQQYKSYCLAVRGPAYGIKTLRVDGCDPRAMYFAIRRARAHAMKHCCPVFVEALCYRLGPHSTSDDATRYRSDEEVKMYSAKAPIGRFFRFLSSKGWWTHEQNDQLIKETRQEAIDALSAAEKAPRPPLTALFTEVYAEVPWNLREQYQELLSFLKSHPEHVPPNTPIG